MSHSSSLAKSHKGVGLGQIGEVACLRAVMAQPTVCFIRAGNQHSNWQRLHNICPVASAFPP